MIRTNKRKPGSITATPCNRKKDREPETQNLYDLERYIETEQFQKSDNFLKESKQNCWRNDKTEKKIIKELKLSNINLNEKGIVQLDSALGNNLMLQSIVNLSLDRNRITCFPSSIFNKLTSLEELSISENEIEKISFPYLKYSNLKNINISYNKLTSINTEHLSSLLNLNCSHNQITFLTIPHSITTLDASFNCISNIYFLEECRQIVWVSLSNNNLYDLKLNLCTKGFRREEIRYKKLRYLDCSCNKITYFEGLIHIVNLEQLRMEDNQIGLTRNLLNEILTLQNLKNLNIDRNPIDEGGFDYEQIITMFVSKISTLVTINGQLIDEPYSQENVFCSQKKSQFSIHQEPYQLFMETNQIQKDIDWNFTLGDCEQTTPKIPNINDMSLIQELEHVDMIQTIKSNQKPTIMTNLHSQTVSQQKNKKVKIIRSSSVSTPHHVHFQPFLKKLLPLSYIPSRPMFHGSSKISSQRLDSDDDEYCLISEMFANRGGIVYLKKIMNWMISENNSSIFSCHSQSNSSLMGFYLNDMTEREFRELAKCQKLIHRKTTDIIGQQPNVFSCFHIIVRTSSHSESVYNCAYLIQSNHI